MNSKEKRPTVARHYLLVELSWTKLQFDKLGEANKAIPTSIITIGDQFAEFKEAVLLVAIVFIVYLLDELSLSLISPMHIKVLLSVGQEVKELIWIRLVLQLENLSIKCFDFVHWETFQVSIKETLFEEDPHNITSLVCLSDIKLRRFCQEME